MEVVLDAFVLVLFLLLFFAIVVEAAVAKTAAVTAIRKVHKKESFEN